MTQTNGKKIAKFTSKFTKNKKTENKYSTNSATAFFYREISTLLSSEKTTQKKIITALINANSRFKKQISDSPQENFWVLFDQEIFNSKQKILTSEELKTTSQTRDINKRALGLLRTVSSNVAFNKKIFQEVVNIYKNAYQLEETPILTEALDDENSNILHIICQMLASRYEDNSIDKKHWEVYEYLVQDENYKHLLKKVDKYDRKPSQFLEEVGLIPGKEQQLLYAVPHL